MASSRKLRAGRAFVEFFLEDGALRRGLAIAERRVRQFGARVSSVGKTMLTGGLAGLTSFILPTRTFMQFDDAIRATQAVTQALGNDFDLLKETALELGRTTSFTAVEVASLMTELGRAGFKPGEIVKMTGAVLDLARATGTEATMSAGIMAAALRQFHLEADQAAHVADVFTIAANKTFNTVEALGEALTYAGPVAHDLGMSLEETLGILGMLGNVGIQGSNAGTALRRLGTITAAEADKMKELFGVDFINPDGSLRPLITVFGELGEAARALPDGERIKRMNDAFGLLGITSASVMSGVAVDAQALVKALNGLPGTARKTAEAMDAGIGGAWRRMMSAIEGTTIAIGESLGPTLERLGNWIGEVATKTTEWIAKNEAVIVSVAYGVAAFTAAGTALFALGIALKIVATGLALVGAALTLLMNPWFLLTAGVVALVAHLGGAMDAFGDFAKFLTDTFGPAWDAIRAKISSGDIVGAMELMWESAKAAWEIGINKLMMIWEKFVARVKGQISKWKHWMRDRLLGMFESKHEVKLRQLREGDPAKREQAAIEQQHAAQVAEREAAIQAARDRLAKIIDDAKPEPEPAKKPGPAPEPPPEQKMQQQVMQRSRMAVTEHAATIDAVSRDSVEGQKIILEAMGFKTKADPAVAAIESLELTLEDEFERTRRENANAPRLQGSRRS